MADLYAPAGDYTGLGFIGNIGGDLPQAPTATAIPGPTATGDATPAGLVPLPPPPPIMGGTPPIVPGATNPGNEPGQASGCSTCQHSYTPAGAPVAAAPPGVVRLSADATGLGGATTAPTAPAAASTPVPWWVWVALAFLVGYGVKRGR